MYIFLFLNSLFICKILPKSILRIDSCNILCACIWFSSLKKINQYSQLRRNYFTSDIYFKYGYFFIYCWNECCLKTCINLRTCRIYLLEPWFFYYVQRINIHKYFFDPSIFWSTNIYMSQNGKIFHACDVHFSENASSTNISNVLEQSLMELRHPKFSLLLFLFPP